MKQIKPSWHSDTSPTASQPVAQGSSCVLYAKGFYSILEQSGVCDQKEMLLPMRLVEEIVAYVLDGEKLWACE
jgi:hypothetical protein